MFDIEIEMVLKSGIEAHVVQDSNGSLGNDHPDVRLMSPNSGMDHIISVNLRAVAYLSACT
jgi:hypothetical protein